MDEIKARFIDMKQQVRDKLTHARSQRTVNKWTQLYENLKLYEQLYKTQFGPTAQRITLELISRWFELEMGK